MSSGPLRLVFLGLSITSSWGNGHATTYRALLRELARRGHDVLFLERDVPWYRDNRDMPQPPFGRTELYTTEGELRDRFTSAVRDADAVCVGSFVPDGVSVGTWVQATARGVTCFYDIDTPVTLARLARGDHEYLAPALVPGYDIYFSFTGGPTLDRLLREFGAPRARPLYCSVDPERYAPTDVAVRWDLGYLGTYSADRQPGLDALLMGPARSLPEGAFCVAGPLYPDDRIDWPPNVERIQHVAPADHPAFYGAQRFTLNITRADMREAGWSPSVRLFEAAAAGVPIITDAWPGLDEFFEPGREILVARSGDDVRRWLAALGDDERRAIADRARARVLAAHTAAHRAAQFEHDVLDVIDGGALRSAGGRAGLSAGREGEAP